MDLLELRNKFTPRNIYMHVSLSWQILTYSVKWQKHFQRKGEKKAGQWVREIRKVFVRVE